jgi:hypothetical protein
MRTGSKTMGALVITSALSFACDPGTRVAGSIALEDGLEVGDDERHTLYVAAFHAGDVTGAVFDTGAAPAFVEFGGIENADFDPDVGYELGGAGAAEEMHVFAWWKIGDAEHPDYELPEEGDRFGMFAENPVFEGASGNDSASQHHVDIVLDRTYGIDTAGFAFPVPH